MSQTSSARSSSAEAASGRAADGARSSSDPSSSENPTETGLTGVRFPGADLDDLTGAYRQEMGELALSNEVERARRSDGRFVVAYIEPEPASAAVERDHVLRTLGVALRTNLRPFDPIVRYDVEFVCGLGGVALSTVDRRLAAIAETVKAEAGVKLSVGLAALEPGETLGELIARAGDARTTARQGRRRK